MNNCWFYLIHLAAFAAGILLMEAMRRRALPWSWRAAVAVLAGVAMAVFVFRISEPPDRYSDFVKAYYPAARAVLSENGAAGLAESMNRGAGGFVNLPVLAYLFAPFGLLSPGHAETAFLLAGILATIAAWFVLCRLAGLDRDRSLLLLFVFAACGPLHNSVREGNTTHMVLLLLVLGVWLLRGRHDFPAGLLIGFAALIKLPLLLLGIYFVLRGRWKAGLGGGVICLAAGFASVMIFGWDLHAHWYENSIKPFAENPLAAFNVQSIQGFIARLQHGPLYLTDWDPPALDPAFRQFSRLAVLFMMAAVAVVLAWPRRWKPDGLPVASASSIMELEISVIILLAMVTSTVSWTHYYLWMLLPAAYLIGASPPAPLAMKWLRVYGWVAVIASLPPVMIVRFGGRIPARLHASLAVSHYLLAGLLLLAVLLAAVWWTGGEKSVRSR
ncbi:MAG: glycosyltransferase family 87 protein [Luteolibacter sp.]|jgi:hypothetical protein|nr:glycosyltransferase family 87 protein [Luteolibacter sp.]